MRKVPLHTMKLHEGVEVYLHSPVTSSTYEEYSASSPGKLTPAAVSPLSIWRWDKLSWPFIKENKSPFPSGNRTSYHPACSLDTILTELSLLFLFDVIIIIVITNRVPALFRFFACGSVHLLLSRHTFLLPVGMSSCTNSVKRIYLIFKPNNFIWNCSCR